MNQSITIGTRVRVHMNLHKRRQGLPHWSVTDPSTGKVIGNVTTWNGSSVAHFPNTGFMEVR